MSDPDDEAPALAKARYPGEIWDLHNGGLGVVLSSRMYNQAGFGTVVIAEVMVHPHQSRPFVVRAGLNERGEEVAVYVDRLVQIPIAWLVQRRGSLAPKALAECDQHLRTLFLR